MGSLGDEGYDLGVDTVLFAQRLCIKAIFRVVGRGIGCVGAVYKMGLQGDKWRMDAST